MSGGASAQSLLDGGLKTLAITANAAQRQRLLDYCALVLRANETTNLVGRHSLEELIVKDVLDSLAPFSDEPPRSPMIDMGSGAGFPGIPIAIVFAGVRATLLEPRAKRDAFLAEAIERLGLRNVNCVKKTAGAAASTPLEGSALLVTARAFGPVDAAIQAAAPLLHAGGSLLLYRGKDASPSKETLDFATHAGLQLRKASQVSVPYLEGARHAWWFSKAGRPRQPVRKARR